MIRKRGKANWEHECKVCKITSTYPDQFRAIEAHQKHARSLGHLGSAIVEGFRPFMDFLDAFTAPLAPMSGLDYIVPGCSPTLKSPCSTSPAKPSSTLAPSKPKPNDSSA